jgi:hypothetical protein
MGGLPLSCVDPVLAISPTDQSILVLLFTGVAAPIAGLLLRRIGDSWDSIGKGPFAIEQEPPSPSARSGRAPRPVDPAIQAAEVRQMLRAKSERRERRGEPSLDVEAEATRLLVATEAGIGADASRDAELRGEVRQLVIVRNERRMRRGLKPLDVEAEVERQLTDFVGSG